MEQPAAPLPTSLFPAPCNVTAQLTHMCLDPGMPMRLSQRPDGCAVTPLYVELPLLKPWLWRRTAMMSSSRLMESSEDSSEQ